MSNKKMGNSFESELCELLAEEGFWCHNLAQNAAGQPADVIAVKDGEAYLIDCKVCSQGKFPFSRIEDNQESSMLLWRECDNGEGLFALKFDSQIYMVSLAELKACSRERTYMTRSQAEEYGVTLEQWLWVRR